MPRADYVAMARRTLVPRRCPPTDDVISEIRDREHKGAIELPKR
jgi:hypothetical protein